MNYKILKGDRQMSINKNDCFDCDHCTKENLWSPQSPWVCAKTGLVLGIGYRIDTSVEDCEHFKYQE